ncbi:PIR protein, partial [Plasmodium vivax]
MESAENKEHMLPSEKIYKEYNKSYVNLDNNSKCEDLTGKIRGFPDIDKLCNRLIMNLKNLNNKDKNDPSVIYDCKYLHYWMNDRVINELNVIDDAQYIAKINKLYIAWHDIIKTLDKEKYICEPNRGPLITLPVRDFLFRKEMYDYYYNYIKIKNQEFSYVNDCSETCNYLTSINKKYETFKSACSPSTHNKCVPEFKNFDKYDPIKLIRQLGCKNQSQCNRNEVIALDQNSDETQVNEVSAQHQTVDVNPKGSTENGSSKTILNVALPASVFFVLFPMLYKMTPLGSR